MSIFYHIVFRLALIVLEEIFSTATNEPRLQTTLRTIMRTQTDREKNRKIFCSSSANVLGIVLI